MWTVGRFRLTRRVGHQGAIPVGQIEELTKRSANARRVPRTVGHRDRIGVAAAGKRADVEALRRSWCDAQHMRKERLVEGAPRWARATAAGSRTIPQAVTGLLERAEEELVPCLHALGPKPGSIRMDQGTDERLIEARGQIG